MVFLAEEDPVGLCGDVYHLSWAEAGTDPISPHFSRGPLGGMELGFSLSPGLYREVSGDETTWGLGLPNPGWEWGDLIHGTLQGQARHA